MTPNRHVDEQRSLASDPATAALLQAIEALGDALLSEGQWDAAAACYAQVLRQAPDNVNVHHKYGGLLVDAGRLDEGLFHLDRVLAVCPDFASAHFNRGLALLQQGDFRRGWAEYRWRWRCPELSAHPLQRVPKPAWDGRPLQGQTILLHHEQGFGDTIQFARYAPLVAARGGRVVLGSPPQLKRLLQSVPGVDRVAAAADPPVSFQEYASLMDLPAIFDTQLDSVPAAVPYLQADPDRVRHWAVRLPGSSHPRVGLVWAGNPQHHRDARRSTTLGSLAPLAEVDGVQFISLQKGVAEAEASAPPAGMRLSALGPQLADFMDTAAVVAQLDLVISVDTSVAHLAGALGRPVWLLLSAAHDWRWLVDREGSPWYPTLRIFRQAQPGDWRGLAERVAQALAERVNG